MNSLVFVVEECIHLKSFFTRLLGINGISYIFASNSLDATELFKHNKELITYIVFDENSSAYIGKESFDILAFAKVIGNSKGFHGTIFATSSVPAHYDVLNKVLGDKLEKYVNFKPLNKLETINEIIRRILLKRKKGV